MQGSQPLWQQSSSAGSVGGVGCGSSVREEGGMADERKDCSIIKPQGILSLRQYEFTLSRAHRIFA